MKLRIGGVPEHFNMPWHLLLQNGILQRQGIEPSWTDYSGGTGAMVDALNNDEVDVAMLLTDGAVRGIDKGGGYKILGFYVTSPLIWGIHVPAASKFKTMDDVRGHRYAISRYGSGSHMMAFVDAKNRNWAYNNLKFEVVNNLDGARESFKKEDSEIFMWEKFTTKPYIDNGEFRRIGECPTPYPCFVICASNKALKEKGNAVFEAIDNVFATSKELFTHRDRIELIAKRFNLLEEDVKEWLKNTRWTRNLNVKEETFQNVIDILVELDLISTRLKFEDLMYQRTPEILFY